MRWIIALLLLGLSGACDDAPAPGPAGPPNVILIVMDTTRGDRCSFSGYGRRTTPSIESLVPESTVYTDAWSPSSWTLPAHASLFTGNRVESHGTHVGGRLFLSDAAVTLAERLKAAGYATSCFSSNAVVSDAFGLTQGFDIHEVCPRVATAGPPTAPWANQRALIAVREARATGKPFFVFINDWEPHLPYDPPSRFAARFVRSSAPASLVLRARDFLATKEVIYSFGWRSIGSAQWDIMRDLYDAEIASLDRILGELLDALRREGALDDTMLVITSDHGENLGDHDLCGHVLSLHRTLLHVPLLIRYPDGRLKGEVVGTTVRLEDIFPTVLEVCGQPVPEGIDGVSLLTAGEPRVARALLGGEFPKELAEMFPEFAASGRWKPIRSVYDGRHHLMLRDDGHEELYDVVADPLEKRNLLPAEEDIAVSLRAMLPSFRKSVSPPK